MLGELAPGEPLIIAEGYATAATLREMTSIATVVAFDSGNLLDVARAYRAADPTRPIILAADNDHHLPRREVPLPNVGREKAEAAAVEVGGTVLLPAFTSTDKGTDWNDYAVQHGRDAMRQVIVTELARRGVEVKAAEPAKAAASQAARDAARRSVSRAGTARQSAQDAARRQVEQRKSPSL